MSNGKGSLGHWRLLQSKWTLTELSGPSSCVKVEVAVLGALPLLIIKPTVSVEVKHHSIWTFSFKLPSLYIAMRNPVSSFWRHVRSIVSEISKGIFPIWIEAQANRCFWGYILRLQIVEEKRWFMDSSATRDWGLSAINCICPAHKCGLVKVSSFTAVTAFTIFVVFTDVTNFTALFRLYNRHSLCSLSSCHRLHSC